jgi:hypothetical protein
MSSNFIVLPLPLPPLISSGAVIVVGANFWFAAEESDEGYFVLVHDGVSAPPAAPQIRCLWRKRNLT